MKIALIGPGIMSIPPKNWGAVESLIWDYYEYLKELEIEVDIINSKDLNYVANKINSENYDFIHLHYDDHAKDLNYLIKKQYYVTSHYGYIKEHYNNYKDWDPIFKGLLKCPGLIVLSQEIKEIFLTAGYRNKIKILRNGARTKQFKFNDTPSKNSICLGKIEPRKRQSDLAKICSDKCIIDFVGPCIDESFKDNNTCKKIGIWSKPDLYVNLTDYKCLILISDGEAAPLVVPEALSAGLSLVISETASANLDKSLPFIHVTDINSPENLVNTINKAVSENHLYRNDIRKYAIEHFDWSVICKEYLQIIKELNNEQ